MIFVIRGASCSGKDTFIEKHFDEHTVLSSDKIRLMLFDNVKDQSRNGLVFEFLRELLVRRLSFGTSHTVINATNLKYKDFEAYLDIASEYQIPLTVISIDPPPLEELIRRNNIRGDNGGLRTPDEVLERHYNSYYNSMPRSVDMAKYHFKWIRINQDYEVVDEI